MPIEISEYQFAGPYTSISDLQRKAGVYVILCRRTDGKYYVIDVGQAINVKERIENHNRKSCWTRNCDGTLSVAVFYTQYESERTRIEKIIRNTYNPPCGDR
ncbi:MAG: GIY-YIG nuclease family protein [Nitrospirae bacterium]|nr:GIY-YIG nuclease family protein [Nitrospirota bacterium]